MSNTERTCEVSITMNRASLGDANNTFAIIRGGGGRSLVAWVPRDRITIDEQPVGREFTGKLKVDVIEKQEKELLVETKSDGQPVRFWMESDSQKILNFIDMTIYPRDN